MNDPKKDTTKIELELEGLGCGSCAETVREALWRVPGIERVEASFDEKLARVWTTDPSLAEDPSPLLKAVQAEGYGARLHRSASSGAG